MNPSHRLLLCSPVFSCLKLSEAASLGAPSSRSCRYNSSSHNPRPYSPAHNSLSTCHAIPDAQSIVPSTPLCTARFQWRLTRTMTCSTRIAITWHYIIVASRLSPSTCAVPPRFIPCTTALWNQNRHRLAEHVMRRVGPDFITSANVVRQTKTSLPHSLARTPIPASPESQRRANEQGQRWTIYTRGSADAIVLNLLHTTTFNNMHIPTQAQQSAPHASAIKTIHPLLDTHARGTPHAYAACPPMSSKKPSPVHLTRLYAREQPFPKCTPPRMAHIAVKADVRHHVYDMTWSGCLLRVHGPDGTPGM